MKKYLFACAAFASALAFTACSSDDDDNTPTPTPEEPETATARIEMEASVGADLLKYTDVNFVYCINEEDSVVVPITTTDTIKVVKENLPYTNANLKVDAYIRTKMKSPLPAYNNSADTLYNFKKDLNVVGYYISNKGTTYAFEKDALVPWKLTDFEVPGNELENYLKVAYLEYHLTKDKQGNINKSSEAN